VSNGGGAQLLFCNIPARQPQSLVGFYSTLLGAGDSFVENQQSPIPQYQEALTGDGVDLTISQRQDTRDVTTAYWSVSDIDDMIGRLTQLGGEIVTPPTDTPDGGRTAMVLDPEGNFVGLMQVPEESHEYFQLGKFGAELTDEVERRREQLRTALEGSAR
jgi:predicted enzyme related to lactoylglutathione lyase